MSDAEECPRGSVVYVHVLLPDGLDCSAEALSGYPMTVVHALRYGSRMLKLPSFHEELPEVLKLPGVQVQRYFRSTSDPLRFCWWDQIGLTCRHDPACSE